MEIIDLRARHKAIISINLVFYQPISGYTIRKVISDVTTHDTYPLKCPLWEDQYG